jgi:hypothetical protein
MVAPPPVIPTVVKLLHRAAEVALPRILRARKIFSRHRPLLTPRIFWLKMSEDERL